MLIPHTYEAWLETDVDPPVRIFLGNAIVTNVEHTVKYGRSEELRVAIDVLPKSVSLRLVGPDGEVIVPAGVCTINGHSR